MRRPCELALLGALLACCFGIGVTKARAATPSFTISATDVTMPLNTQTTCSNGVCTTQYGYSTFSITSLNGYTGAPQVTCAAANPPVGAVLPTCYQHGPSQTLPANGTVSGEILFIAPGQGLPPTPASLLNLPGRSAPGMALAAALLFGLGLRRRAARWFTLTLLALGLLSATAAISACGGNSNTMTFGTFTYTVTATDANTGESAATTINVTIP